MYIAAVMGSVLSRWSGVSVDNAVRGRAYCTYLHVQLVAHCRQPWPDALVIIFLQLLRVRAYGPAMQSSVK
jgi:hypothetical protein